MKTINNILICISILLIIGITGCIENTKPYINIHVNSFDVTNNIDPGRIISSRPSAGHIFLVMNITIYNQGYEQIRLSPDYWYAKNNNEYKNRNIRYPYDTTTRSFRGFDGYSDIIYDGDGLNGKVAFSVPDNGSALTNYNYKVIFDDGNYNINYN